LGSKPNRLHAGDYLGLTRRYVQSRRQAGSRTTSLALIRCALLRACGRGESEKSGRKRSVQRNGGECCADIVALILRVLPDNVTIRPVYPPDELFVPLPQRHDVAPNLYSANRDLIGPKKTGGNSILRSLSEARHNTVVSAARLQFVGKVRADRGGREGIIPVRTRIVKPERRAVKNNKQPLQSPSWSVRSGDSTRYPIRCFNRYQLMSSLLFPFPESF